MKRQSTELNGADKPGLVALSKWIREAGITAVTAWRFRKRGWIQTINIAGRVYISLAEIQRFTERAAAGEFAKHHPTPNRPATLSPARAQ